jgi:predicted DNA-binding protein YlxM (UPF0122 family)
MVRNMSLKFMRDKGIRLPPTETDYSSITAQQIMDKIKAFYDRFEKESLEISDFGEGYFLEFMANYPVSMCSSHMTEALKLVVAIVYFDSKPSEEAKKCEMERSEALGIKSDVWDGYSFDELALVFDRSKATIHECIRQKGAEAKAILSEITLRQEAKNIALEELIKEEKDKLLSEKQRNNQTSERTPI